MVKHSIVVNPPTWAMYQKLKKPSMTDNDFMYDLLRRLERSQKKRKPAKQKAEEK